MSHRKLAVLQPAPPEEVIRPLPPPVERNENIADENPLHATRKRVGININGACEPCRKGKRRCDGAKPVCGACLKRDINHNRCVYDQLEGLSRAETLKHNAQMLKAERDTLRTFVKDLLSAAPETTLQDGIRLTEEHGLLLPSALRLEINDIIRRKLPNHKDTHLGDDSILTPLTTVNDVYSGPSSPDFDVSYQRSMFGSSTSPVGQPVSPNLERASTSRGSFSGDCRPRPDDRSENGEQRSHPLFGSSSRPVLNSQQALSALCDRMAQENCNSRFPNRYLAEDQPASPVTSHLQIYAHLPLPNSSGLVGWPTALAIQDPQILNFQIPMYMVQPLLLQDYSPLSRTVVGFLELARTRVKQGWPLLNILGAIDFDVSRLISNGNGYNPQSDTFSVPGWATSVAMTFPDTSTIVKLSLALQLARLMRWLIAPTPDNYDLIPESQKPTPLQRMVPHKAEFDCLMLPALRDALITKPREYIQVYFDSAKCDWAGGAPYVEVDSRTNTVRITAEFERYITNVDNWFFDPSLLRVFPELQGKCNLHADKT